MFCFHLLMMHNANNQENEVIWKPRSWCEQLYMSQIKRISLFYSIHIRQAISYICISNVLIILFEIIDYRGKLQFKINIKFEGNTKPYIPFEELIIENLWSLPVFLPKLSLFLKNATVEIDSLQRILKSCWDYFILKKNAFLTYLYFDKVLDAISNSSISLWVLILNLRLKLKFNCSETQTL